MWRLRFFRLIFYFVMFIHVYSKVIVDEPVPSNGPFNITIQLNTNISKVTWKRGDTYLYVSDISPSGNECIKSIFPKSGFEFYCEEYGNRYNWYTIEIPDITAQYGIKFSAEYSPDVTETYTVPFLPDPPTTTTPIQQIEDCFTCNAVIITIAFTVVLIVVVVVLLIIHFKYSGEKWITKLDVSLGCVDVVLLAAAITCTVFVARGKECYKDCEDYWKAAVGVDAVAFVMVLVVIIELIRCHHGKCC